MTELKKFKRVPPELVKLHYKFNTLEEFLNMEPKSRKRWPDVNDHNRRKAVELLDGESDHGSNDIEWLGIDGTGADIVKMARTGWPAGVTQMQKFLDQLPPPPKAVSFRRKRRYDEAGQLDVNKFLNGATEDLFLRHERRKVRGHTAVGVTNIFVPLAVSAAVSSTAYFMRGLAACLIAASLEKEGRPVEITGFEIVKNLWRSASSALRCIIEVPIKRAGVPINLDMLAYMTALSGTQRILGFASNYLVSGSMDVSGGLGTPLDEAPPGAREGRDLIISGDINTEAKAVEMVNSFIGFMNEDDEDIVVTAGLGMG